MLEEKQRLVSRLKNAKKAHRRWVSNAQVLMDGMPVKNDQLPLHETDCQFGKWYYGDGQVLRKFDAFQAIEAPHKALHDHYRSIFELLFRERKVSLLGRLLGRKAKPTAAEMAQAKQLLAELNRDSITIIQLLDDLEKLVLEIDDQTFGVLFLTEAA